MNLLVLFITCLTALWLCPAYLPSLHLFFFLPFFVAMLYRSSLLACLAVAFGCGFLMDLLSSHVRLGMHSAAYVLTIGLLWGICRLIFFETARAAPFLAMLFSSVSTLLLMGIEVGMGEEWTLSQAWWLKDVLFYSSLDALYTGMCLYVLGGIVRKRSELAFS